LTRIAIHILVKKGELLIWRKNGHFPQDKNPADIRGKTPLHLAVETNQLEIFKLLLEHAKDKNPADNKNTTPLHLAARLGYVKIVKLYKKIGETEKRDPCHRPRKWN
jgi:ankyrin repeat protein